MACRLHALWGDLVPTAGSSVPVVSHDLLPISQGQYFRVDLRGREDPLTRRQTLGVLLEVGRHSPTSRELICCTGLFPPQTPERWGRGVQGSRQACHLHAGLGLPSFCGKCRCSQGPRVPGADDMCSHGATASYLSRAWLGAPSSGRTSWAVWSNGAPGAVLCRGHHLRVLVIDACVAVFCLPLAGTSWEQGSGWHCSLL